MTFWFGVKTLKVFRVAVLGGLLVVHTGVAAEAPSPGVASRLLPGKGLVLHEFLYAGESKNRRAFIVRNGWVVWSYDQPTGRGVAEASPACARRSQVEGKRSV